MVAIPYFSMTERALMGVLFTLSFICGIIYVKRARSEETESRSRFLLLGLGNYFFFAMALQGILLFIAQTMDPGYYIGHIFYHEPRSADETYYFQMGFEDPQFILFRLSNIAGLLGGFGLLYNIEKFAAREHYISLVMISFTPFLIFLPYGVNSIIISIYSVILSVAVMLTFYFLMKKSNRELKLISLLLYLGYATALLGAEINSADFKQLSLFPLELGPIIQIAGLLCWIIPPLIKYELLEKYRNTLKMTPVVIIPLIIIMEIIIIVFVATAVNQLVGAFVSVISSIFVFILYLLNLLHLEELPVTRPSEGLEVSTLEIFTRPKNIDEEEISISKEKKICLVCKGHVSGFNSFICTCDAIYCQKCARALSKLENTCWACGVPLDKNRPVSKQKRELGKEFIKITEDKNQKKKKA